MQRINQYEFYQLGTNIHPLADIKPDTKFNDVFITLWSARHFLQELLKDKLIPLRICIPAPPSLLHALDSCLPADFKKMPPEDWEKPLAGDKVFQITGSLQTFETVFSAELQQLDSYFVSQKGIYSTQDLIEHADRVFPKDTLPNLPEEARKDIREAGRCLAFDLPSATGFHIIRAVEAVIRKYYSVIVKQPVKPKM